MAEEYLTSKDDAITVPFSDDQAEVEKDDKDEELPANASPQQLSEAKRKRQERGKQREEERRRERERAEALAAEVSTLKQELARTQGYIAAQSQQPRQAADAKDEFERRLDAIEEERSAAYAAAQAEVKEGKMTAERAAYWDKKGRAIDERRAETIVERQLARARVGEEQRRQQEEGRQFWRHRHPEVYNDPRAYRWAEGRAAQFIAENNRQMTQDDIDAVMEETKIKFKLGKPQSTATERARMSGIPSSSSGGSSGKGGDSFTFSNEKVKAMAVAAYSHLPEKEALKAWAQKTGKKLRDRKVL